MSMEPSRSAKPRLRRRRCRSHQPRRSCREHLGCRKPRRLQRTDSREDASRWCPAQRPALLGSLKRIKRNPSSYSPFGLLFPLEFYSFPPIHSQVGTPRAQFFDWFLTEFCDNFAARMAMRALKFSPLVPILEPARSDAPKVDGAELASVYCARRMAGDFYDFIRVGPHRVLFCLLDAAGGLQETRAILSAAQHTFRTAGSDLFARDIN